MGTVNANFLPATTGLSLGNQVQEWNLWASLINGLTPVTFNVTTVAFSGTPAFISASPLTVLNMTLSGSVSSSTYGGIPGLVLFQLTQDVTGNRTFAWPANFNGPTTVGSAANQVTFQLFYYDGTIGWPLTPGAIYP